MGAAVDRSEAGRVLSRARWGARVPLRAAETVVERVGELPDDAIAALAAELAEEAEKRQVVLS